MKRILFTLLLACASSLLLCHCDDKGAAIKIKGMGDEIDELSSQNARIESERRRLESQLESILADKQKLEAERQKVEAERAASEKRLEEFKAEFERYKVQYKLSMKTRAPGLKIDDFTALDGKTYTNVVLKEITDSTISFRHNDGAIKNFDAKKLPETVQAKLGLLTDMPNVPATSNAGRSPKQINLEARALHDLAVEKAMKKTADIRKNYVDALAAAQETRNLLRNAIEDHKSTAVLNKKLSEQELRVKQLESMALQSEVDAQAVRNERPKLVLEY